MTARAILVDDHAVVLEGLRALIGAMTDIAIVGLGASGAQAIALVRELAPDIAVIDMGLPGLNGIETSKRMLEIAPELRIVMLTHFEEPVFVQKALAVGIRGYVLKGSASEKIPQAIRTVQSGGVYIDSELEEFRSEWIRKLANGHARTDEIRSPPLTERELQVLRLAAIGHSNKDIARRIGIGVKSVETYRFRACRKLSLHSRLDIVRYGASHGWILDL
jgi:DNA-binding NarL/FixJ family response regulator